MDLGISGKVALVVGGSRGMGRIAAGLLAAEGCNVAVVARTRTDVDEAVSELVAGGTLAFGVCADISSASDVDRAVREVTDALGPPLIVIGQTVFQAPGDFRDITDPETYVESFRAYTMSQIYLLHAVLPGMQAAGWGRFVHVGSATAKEPTGEIHHVVANATRPSTVGLLKTVADEYARYGITVNTIAPGWIETENAQRYMRENVGATNEEERRRFMLDKAGVPAGRMGDPAEIASAIAYLCSEQAGYITGAWIEVDGGHHRSAM
ncbi:MAG TPA: SDR family oxidoreductase [Mycobacteriales bacterium]|jgi:3-oxoacyl-[acyl-carrier protein] reductase|nr:SDR family oxidoreductase [Mycobacteriales bacterium]